MNQRVEVFWNAFLVRYQDSDGNVVIVTHGRFMTFLFCHSLGIDVNGFDSAIDNVRDYKFVLGTEWRTQLEF